MSPSLAQYTLDGMDNDYGEFVTSTSGTTTGTDAGMLMSSSGGRGGEVARLPMKSSMQNRFSGGGVLSEKHIRGITQYQHYTSYPSTL